MSKTKPSRSNLPSAPPYVAARSYTATRCPATASRAADAIAPIPEPITTIRAMPGTLAAGTDNPAGAGGSTRADAFVTSRRPARPGWGTQA
ncbi:hypothetical protein GCM10009730_10240 [Streptomyces albidochromogenes]